MTALAADPPKTRTRRFVGRCKRCKRGASLELEQVVFGSHSSPAAIRADKVVQQGGELLPCPCGHRVRVRTVLGKFRSDVKCDGRCEGATGQCCECSCGGKNHGRAHGAHG